MTSRRDLKPLDKALGEALIWRVLVDNHLISGVSRSHWKPLIQSLHRSPFELVQYVARRFQAREWSPSARWFSDPGIRELFRDYNWERYVMPSRPGTIEIPQNMPRQRPPLNTFGGLTTPVTGSTNVSIFSAWLIVT